MGEEHELAPEEEPSVKDLLDDWREAERDADAEKPGSAAETMAKHSADLARDAFHDREDDEHEDYGDPPRRASHRQFGER